VEPVADGGAIGARSRGKPDAPATGMRAVSLCAAAVAALLLMSAVPARAQGTPSDTVDLIDVWNQIRHEPVTPIDADSQEAMKAIAPVIGVKPSAGAMIGAAGNVAFFMGHPETTHISSVVASLTFSQKHQTSLSGRFALSTKDNRWRVDGDNRAQWTSQDTYGLGTSSEIGSGVNAKYDFFRVHETVFRQIRPSLFAGLGLHFDDHTNIRPGESVSDADWDATAFVAYSQAHGLPLDRQISAGPSAAIVGDTRDSTIDPRRGWFATANYRALIKDFLGGSSGWQLLHVEGRTYVPLDSENRRRLAFWLFGDLTLAGTPPYFDLPATGMDPYGRSGRGYGEGRFRGERLLYGEVEYRATLTENGLLGWVAFLNVTTISNLQEDERLFHSGAPAAGAGLRALVNKRSRTNLCFDVGFGKDGSRGVYLAVQEAF
jgi:Omp85 superfamily domain